MQNEEFQKLVLRALLHLLKEKRLESVSPERALVTVAIEQALAPANKNFDFEKELREKKCVHDVVLAIYKDESHTKENISHFRCVNCGQTDLYRFGNKIIEDSVSTPKTSEVKKNE